MQVNEADTVNLDQGAWIDVDDEGPIDDEVVVSGDGEEINILIERSGA